MRHKIPVSTPFLGDTERMYINEALKKSAISGYFGEYLPEFESKFSHYSECSYGIATSSGTAALHLAMLAMSIKPCDEVLVSTLTNMATLFSILYQGATPVPIDIENDTLNLNPDLLETKITDRTRAIVVVHLFGHPADMNPVMRVAEKYKLNVVEDCAQAHGATYLGKKVGSIGDIGCFSFYANKIITTGEGGMITTNNKYIAERARSIKSLAFGKENKFMHKEIGYNFRMTNLQAAMGCAQMEKIEIILKRKRAIACFYGEHLKDIPELRLPLEKEYARNVYWMYHVLLTKRLKHKRKSIMQKLSNAGIETREGFIPYNMQEIFIDKGWTRPEECPNARDIASSGFYLPSGPELTEEELEYIVTNFKQIISSL